MNNIGLTYLLLLIQITLGLLSLNGRVTYGWGLADIFYFGIFVTLSIVIATVTTYRYREKKDIRIFNLVFLAMTLLNMLQLTILRGSAMPWNGQIFFKF